jgi:hypothetical protein
VNHHGRRKAKKIGTREAAEKVKRLLEVRLASGEFGRQDDGAVISGSRTSWTRPLNREQVGPKMQPRRNRQTREKNGKWPKS